MRHTGLWNGKRTQDAHIQHTTQSAQQSRLLLQPQRNPALVEDAPAGVSGRAGFTCVGEWHQCCVKRPAALRAFAMRQKAV
ncbi:hypothetical protein [Cupriavidus sp. YAF13]|uniref:hypothetical protein n=1 Tax=Cupriavidus sp. YAF13 TaxID=3233075 RepID=UPI003F92DAC7